MPKLLYVTSLSHSGSTLVSLLLGTHPGVYALGEISIALNRLRDEPEKCATQMCSCGEKVENCAIWGNVLKQMQDGNAPTSLAEAYRIVFDAFREVHGDDLWIVDSSKNVGNLVDLAATTNTTLRAIHLVRDVRSFTISQIDVRKRKETWRRPGWMQAPGLFWQWWRRNRRFQRQMAANDIQRCRIGYEELCLDPEPTARNLCAFLGLDYQPLSTDLHKAHSCIFEGNRMCQQEEKRFLNYDTRWFTRGEWHLSNILFPWIMSLNKKWTYSNSTAAKRWSR